MRTLTLGYSPCPNDTFIFYGLVHGRVGTGGYAFKETLEDVETLNRMAFEGRLDVTKVSYGAFAGMRESYCLIRSGGAMGRGCGPLVVAREMLGMDELRGRKVAIPGKNTTAYLLLRLFDPAFGENVLEMPFYRVMDSVISGEADAGLIIHESRFTYQGYGLKEVGDLGRWWEEETGRPIPLGCIIVRRDLGGELVGKIDGFVRESLLYALENRHEPISYIKRHARELENRVINEHIKLYVNDFSVDMGDEGIQAVQELFRMAEERGIVGKSSLPLFV